MPKDPIDGDDPFNIWDQTEQSDMKGLSTALVIAVVVLLLIGLVAVLS